MIDKCIQDDDLSVYRRVKDQAIGDGTSSY